MAPNIHEKKLNQLKNEIADLKGFLGQEKKRNRDLMLANNRIADQLKDLEDERDQMNQAQDQLNKKVYELQEALKFEREKRGPEQNEPSKKNNFAIADANKLSQKHQDELEGAKKKNQQLNDQINYLEDKVRLLEERENQVKKPFASDILKCMFAQVSYIDFMNQKT